MATRTKAKTAATWTTKAASEVGNAAYQALHDSLDTAAGAAKLLRGDLGTSGRAHVREIERLVLEAQRDLRRSGKLLIAELQALAEEASGNAPDEPPAEKAATKERAAAAKPKATPRSAAAKAGATRTAPTARRAAAKPAAKGAAAKPAAKRATGKRA